MLALRNPDTESLALLPTANESLFRSLVGSGLGGQPIGLAGLLRKTSTALASARSPPIEAICKGSRKAIGLGEKPCLCSSISPAFDTDVQVAPTVEILVPVRHAGCHVPTGCPFPIFQETP